MRMLFVPSLEVGIFYLHGGVVINVSLFCLTYIVIILSVSNHIVGAINITTLKIIHGTFTNVGNKLQSTVANLLLILIFLRNSITYYMAYIDLTASFIEFYLMVKYSFEGVVKRLLSILSL